MRFLFFTIGLLFWMIVSGFLYSQSRSDYYDPYDYDLRNYKRESDDDSYFKEYTLPPKNTKPSLVSPKNVRRPVDPRNLFPGLGNVGPGTQLNKLNQNAASESIINPITGELNSNVLNTNRRRESARDWKKKKLEELPPYKETPSRRKEIIFLLTLPFGAAIFAGITYLAGLPSNSDYLRTTPGGVFILMGGAAFSYWNVILDHSNRYGTSNHSASAGLYDENKYGFNFYTHRF